MPFSTVEPKVYQADLVMTSRDLQDRTFVARQNDKYRMDVMHAGKPTMSEIINGSRFVIDHEHHTYYEQPAGGTPSGFVSPADRFFRGKPFATFEEVGRTGTTVQYRVRREGSQDNATLTVDTSTNMIIAQEFTAADGSVTVRYELQDLKLEAEDSLFQVPGGYRRVSEQPAR